MSIVARPYSWSLRLATRRRLWPAAAGCAGVKQIGHRRAAAARIGAADRAGGSASAAAGGIGRHARALQSAQCTDFSAGIPIFDVGVSHDVAGMFGTPSGTADPCVTEPEDGALFPNNWLRPRVRVPGSTGVLKITFHADMEANDLVAYTSGESWALPKDIWTSSRRHIVEQDITVTVQTPDGRRDDGQVPGRARRRRRQHGVLGGESQPAAGKTGVENMDPATIVNDSMLDGVHRRRRDARSRDALKITDVKQQVTMQDGQTQGSHCIGCHTGTPDGDYVAFVDAWPWGAAFADVKPGERHGQRAARASRRGPARTGTTARRPRPSCSTRGTGR